jgi:hypothetical protein
MGHMMLRNGYQDFPHVANGPIYKANHSSEYGARGTVANCNFTCGSLWCEIWYLTLREEIRLRVFENRVLKRIF